MKHRIYPVISSISTSISDFCLDIAINKCSTFKVLFYTGILSFIIQIIYGLFVGITINVRALPILFLYGIDILLGYLFHTFAIKNIPVGFVSMLEDFNVFFVLIIDIMMGTLVLNHQFIIFFLLFLFSIMLFTIETNNLKDENKFKKIKFIGILFALLTVLFYTIEPFLIKLANNLGANEIALSWSYYILAIPFFYFMSKKENEKGTIKDNKSLIKLVIIISIFESIYNISLIVGYIVDTPTIVTIILELRVILLVIISAIFKTDKLNFKKVFAMILCIISVIGICLV